jgi:hypothetical protein
MYRTAMMTATLAMTATGQQVSVTRSGPSDPDPLSFIDGVTT